MQVAPQIQAPKGGVETATQCHAKIGRSVILPRAVLPLRSYDFARPDSFPKLTYPPKSVGFGRRFISWNERARFGGLINSERETYGRGDGDRDCSRERLFPRSVIR